MRLNKYVAQAVPTTRREATKLIQAGKILVNDTVNKNPAHVLEGDEIITYLERTLKAERALYYYLFNKGKETSTENDASISRDLIFTKNADGKSAFPMHEQDLGLTIITNDSALLTKLKNPAISISCTYELLHVTQENVLNIKDDRVKVVSPDENSEINSTTISTTISSFTALRNLLHEHDVKPTRIDRLKLAGLSKKDLPRRHHRKLTTMEINRIKYFGKL